MKTSSKLFGGSHILHLSSTEEKKDILNHLHINTKLQLPEKSDKQAISNNNIPILKNGYYAMVAWKILIYSCISQNINNRRLTCRH